MIKDVKNKKGITLIALVITIIVLLMLAGIAISMIAGNNGVLTKAKEATIVSELSQIVEKVKLEILQKQVSGIDMSEGEYSLNNFGIESEYNKYIVVRDGEIYIKLSSPSDIINLAKRTGILEYRFLPSDYTEVEYIASTGEQIICNVYDVVPSLEVEFSYMPMSFSGQIFAIYDPSAGLQAGSWGVYNNNWLQSHYGTSSSSSAVIGQKQTVVFKTSSISFTTSMKMPLFGRWRGYRDNMCSIRMYNVKIRDNGNLVRDLIPCYRNSNNVIGMYDLVQDKFYTNNGTGTFELPTT